jgi:hypothetical protein
MEKLSQSAKHGKIDLWGCRNAPTRGDHPVEHPRRDLKPSVRRLFG